MTDRIIETLGPELLEMITMPVFQITRFTKKNFNRNTCTKASNILQSFDDTINFLLLLTLCLLI